MKPIDAIRTLKTNFDDEFLFGSDQAYVSFPTRFATVSIPLQETEELIQLVKETTGIFSEYASFQFYVGLNDYTATKTDNCIEFEEFGNDEYSDGARDSIFLEEDEQKALYARLDEELKAHLGKGCEDLLAEARMKMEKEG